MSYTDLELGLRINDLQLIQAFSAREAKKVSNLGLLLTPRSLHFGQQFYKVIRR